MWTAHFRAPNSGAKRRLPMGRRSAATKLLRTLTLTLVIGAGTLSLWPAAGAWAADPTVRYISHRFPMLEFWAKKMGEYPGIKFESELIPFDQALEKMQIHLSQGAP